MGTCCATRNKNDQFNQLASVYFNNRNLAHIPLVDINQLALIPEPLIS